MEHLPDCVRLWNDWDISLNLPKQQQRLRESFAEKCKPHYISKRTARATFTGEEGTFGCDLENNFCGCEEHCLGITGSRQPVPCKYMYRLAYELDLIDEQGRKRNAASNLEISEDDRHNAFRQLVAIIEQYDDDTQYALKEQCHLYYERKRVNNEYRVLRAEKAFYAPFIKDGLFAIVHEPSELLGAQRDLVRRLDAASFAFPSDLAKTQKGTVKIRAKYDWCLQNPAAVAPIAYPELVALQPTELLQKSCALLFQYFRRKFCDTLYEFPDGRKIQVPSGVKIRDFDAPTYDFPDDIVTEMLNQYGHNRCINYTEPRKVHEPMAFNVTFIPKR